jgi:ATP/ADP translocase
MKDSFEFDQDINSYLRETAKWAKLLGILGYVGIGFLVLFSFFVKGIFEMLPETNMQQIPTSALSIVYFVLAGIYFFPVNYLYQFGKNMRRSLETEDQELFKGALKNLKSHYKFIGMFALVIVSLYGVLFLSAFIGFIIA